MSKKFIPVVLALTVASVFVAFKSQGRGGKDDNPKSKYAKVLRNVGIMLEEGHYSPKKIDDAFSKQVLSRFVSDLDDNKDMFLQSDIDAFKKYEDKIDDEIHGSEIKSFYAINEIYLKRRDESLGQINELLSKPFDFTANEAIQANRDKAVFPKTETERKEIWRKTLKYSVLARYADMQEEREKNKGKKDFVVKADSTLEREAREQIKRRMERFMNNRKNHETIDQNFSTFVNAVTLQMDPHTDYFPPIDKRSFDEGMSGKFYGIGAGLKDDDGKIKIGSIVTGMPADRSGEIKVDDEILKVGEGAATPVDVTGYAVPDAVKLIRGVKGTEVRLTIKKVDGTVKVIALKRDEIKLEDTYAKSAVVNGTHKIGYIFLPDFYRNFQETDGASCATDVANEVKKLKAENVEGIVLDLRGNGGGSLYDAVRMVGFFIEDGPVVQVKNRDDKQQVLKDPERGILYDGPLTVMVDEFSASASEIFAAAIQDYKRGIVVGSTSTHGKGTVQRNFPLTPESENRFFADKNAEDLGALKLTLQKFYRINGGATQLKGVVPDVVLADRYETLKYREKDTPAALPWDEISKADYKPWAGAANNDAVIGTINTQVNATGSVFSKIREVVTKLEAYSQKESSLNIVKYKEEQKAAKDLYKQLDDLTKLTKDINVTNIPADEANINAAKDRADRNKQWLKRLSGDIYLDETVRVIYNMIEQKGTAAKK